MKLKNFRGMSPIQMKWKQIVATLSEQKKVCLRAYLKVDYIRKAAGIALVGLLIELCIMMHEFLKHALYKWLTL